MSIFQHKKIELPINSIKISPSQIANFFNYPSIWFEENILNKDKNFIGNTASVTGTCCHYIYEQYGNNPKEFTENKEYYFNIVEQELKEHLNSNINLAINCDLNTILLNYPQIAKTVVNNYISENIPDNTELSLYTNIDGYDNIFLSGTIDNITRDIIVDYKNVSSKPSDLVQIPFHYKIQLLAYRYMYQKLYKKNINYIRIVYGVAPTKTLPARCFVVTETVTKEDNEMFKDTVKLIAESIKICKENNSLIPLIFKSMKLEGTKF